VEVKIATHLKWRERRKAREKGRRTAMRKEDEN